MDGMANKLVGLLICIITTLVIFREWGIADWTQPAKPVLVLVLAVSGALVPSGFYLDGRVDHFSFGCHKP